MKTDYITRRRAYNLFLDQKGYKLAAKELNLNESTVRDWFRRFRVGPEASYALLNENPNKKRYSPELKDKVIQLRKEGFSWTEILKVTGVPVATLKNWVKRANQL